MKITPDHWLTTTAEYARDRGLHSSEVYIVVSARDNEVVGIYSRERGWLLKARDVAPMKVAA